jgi:gentisate 1,2-dioxygenase
MAAPNVANGNGLATNGHIKVPAKSIETEDQLVQQMRSLKTAPLWAQMQRLNPPAPNPQTVPHVWAYEELRPYLLRAGDLITEKQAERRVVMLANPARGKSPALPSFSLRVILHC